MADEFFQKGRKTRRGEINKIKKEVNKQRTERSSKRGNWRSRGGKLLVVLGDVSKVEASRRNVQLKLGKQRR